MAETIFRWYQGKSAKPKANSPKIYQLVASWGFNSTAFWKNIKLDSYCMQECAYLKILYATLLTNICFLTFSNWVTLSLTPSRPLLASSRIEYHLWLAKWLSFRTKASLAYSKLSRTNSSFLDPVCGFDSE